MDDPPTPPPALKESTSSSAVDGTPVHTRSQVSASRLPPQALSLRPSCICLKLSLESDCCVSPPAIISVPAKPGCLPTVTPLPSSHRIRPRMPCYPVASDFQHSSFTAMIFYGLPFSSFSPDANSPSALPRDIGVCPAFEVVLFPVLYPLLLNHLPPFLLYLAVPREADTCRQNLF